MIDLTRLKAFIHSAETLSFSEASKFLHLSQPTISHHIKKLEESLGVVLFERNGNQLTLSEAGNLLLPWARKLVQQSNEIKDLISSTQERAIGHLKIACSAASGKYILPHLAARFRNRFPEVEISILPCTPGQIAQRLLEEEANLALISTEISGMGLEAQTLYIDTIQLIVPANHSWAEQGKISPADLLDESLIVREETAGSFKVVMTELAKESITRDDLNIFLELGNAEGIVQAVGAGYGVAFVSELLAKDAESMGKIAVVNVEGWALHRRAFLTRKILRSPQRVTDAFWTFVHDPSNIDLLPTPFSSHQD